MSDGMEAVRDGLDVVEVSVSHVDIDRHGEMDEVDGHGLSIVRIGVVPRRDQINKKDDTKIDLKVVL